MHSCAVCVTIFSNGSIILPGFKFTELHALTLAARSYMFLHAINSDMGELISLSSAMQVLAGIVPRHFGQSKVFERFIALLRNQDKEVGRACSVHMCSYLILEDFTKAYFFSPFFSLHLSL